MWLRNQGMLSPGLLELTSQNKHIFHYRPSCKYQLRRHVSYILLWINYCWNIRLAFIPIITLFWPGTLSGSLFEPACITVIWVEFGIEKGETMFVAVLLSNTNVTVCGSASIDGLSHITLWPTPIWTCCGTNAVNLLRRVLFFLHSRLHLLLAGLSVVFRSKWRLPLLPLSEEQQ